MSDQMASNGSRGPVRGEQPRVLLVSDSRRWHDAVQAAAARLGAIGVDVCPPREAVLRLAGTAERFSHVLVQPGSAAEWLDDILELTVGVDGPAPEALLLGASVPPWPRVGVIPTADQHAVCTALTPPGVAVIVDIPSMHASELHDALDGAMIDTRYQPIVRMADRQPMSLEALARLNHPTRGMLLPVHFVPQMETAGLAAKLTDLVASRAFADMAGPIGELGLILALNLPLDVMLVPEALAKLEARRQEAGIPADRVAVELTESRPVDDLTALGHAVTHLRAGGYRVSIDDVGPAVPCVQELLHLPFTSVKLDKQVVQQSDQAGPAAFIADVVRSARRGGIAVIAEGVEDITTWHRIEDLGADHAQGFLVARPLASSAVPIWFEAWTHRSALSAG